VPQFSVTNPNAEGDNESYDGGARNQSYMGEHNPNRPDENMPNLASAKTINNRNNFTNNEF
jgi:hypothetical protein